MNRVLWGRRLIAGIVVLALAYVVTGRLGLELAHYQSNVTLVWPPTGIALAALVLFGWRLWPGVFLGALAVNLSVGTPLLGALGVAIGNTLEAVLGVLVLVHLTRFDPAFARTRDVLTFFAVGAFGCTLVSASVATATLALIGGLDGRDGGVVWLLWWLGDLGGALLVAPLLLVCARGSPRWAELASRKESWAVLALVVASSVAAFGPWLAGHWVASLLAFLPFPFVIWAGMRLGPRGVVIAVALTCSAAIVGTALGGGPFAGRSPHESLLFLWAYGAALGASAAILAAAVAERDAAEAARQQAEDARRAIEVQMERAQRLEMLGVLASGIAHDFSNLLTIVRANAELAAIDASVETTAALADIGRASDRARMLCRQLLDYAGGSVRRPEPVRLDELALDVAGLLGSALPKSIELSIQTGEVAPAVMADPGQLRQVLMNLVLNAVDAIGAPEGRVAVRVYAADAPSIPLDDAHLRPEAIPLRWAILEVEDDGDGMDDATRRRVFEPFFTTKEHGRGLGLAALLGIVRAHGGGVRVMSRPGAGTTFQVLLPVPEAAQ